MVCTNSERLGEEGEKRELDPGCDGFFSRSSPRVKVEGDGVDTVRGGEGPADVLPHGEESMNECDIMRLDSRSSTDAWQVLISARYIRDIYSTDRNNNNTHLYPSKSPTQISALIEH